MVEVQKIARDIAELKSKMVAAIKRAESLSHGDMIRQVKLVAEEMGRQEKEINRFFDRNDLWMMSNMEAEALGKALGYHSLRGSTDSIMKELRKKVLNLLGSMARSSI